ncbi:hypothetical protein [Streptomyces bluensis]|uniref:hypothetical protein n=1 Tax=Streptomyces bluensis TaxID=33897 RepID=UPI001673EA7D|nr:hypothetical protein [Streptomyces bluensis]GGZ92841.1 hypothetical protein GCM10010344_70660 [Streptomyces bluensis]
MLARGYREKPPVEGPPSGGDTRIWTIVLDRIAVERWDADAASWNGVVADHSEFSVNDYMPETGIELLNCPRCRITCPLEVTGHWGGPLTFTCPGGHTTIVEAHENPRLNWGPNLLARLILTEADPASWARTLLRRVTAWRDKEHEGRREPWYTGPDKRDARIAENTDLTTADLAQALHTAIGIQLPLRHAGRPLELLLVHATLALATPAIRHTDDGRALDAEIRALLDDIRTEWQRTAPTRVLVRDQLHAWRDEGGPEEWQAAWDRTLQLVEVRLGGYTMGQDGLFAEAAAALTTAIYIEAMTNSLPPSEVTAEQVIELAALHLDTREVPALWEARLRDLGHDPEDTADPVARLWQRLRIDHTSEPPLTPMHTGRFGPAVTDGIRTAIRSNYSFFPHSLEAA